MKQKAQTRKPCVLAAFSNRSRMGHGRSGSKLMLSLVREERQRVCVKALVVEGRKVRGKFPGRQTLSGRT